LTARLLLPLGSALACGQTIIEFDDDREPPVRAQSPEPEAPEAAVRPVATDAGATDAGLEPDLDRGLLLYLPFDETEPGALARDASGNGLDGTPSESPPTPALSTPPVGFDNPRSLSFDGSSQLVDLGNPRILDVGGNTSIAAWIRPLATDGYRNVVAHGFRWQPDLEVVLRVHDDYYEFLSWTGGIEDHMARAPIGAGDIDSWHHLAGVYDGLNYRLYRDGELIAQVEDRIGPTAIDAAWAIGGRSEPTPGEARYFAGLIDEVRIYGRALSDEEVRALARR
jgi:hypothetical protein